MSSAAKQARRPLPEPAFRTPPPAISAAPGPGTASVVPPVADATRRDLPPDSAVARLFSNVSGNGITPITITLPLGDPLPSAGFKATESSARHLDVQLRTRESRRALLRLRWGLDQSGVRTSDGRRVVTYADAGRWLFEQIALQIEPKTAQMPSNTADTDDTAP